MLQHWHIENSTRERGEWRPRYGRKQWHIWRTVTLNMIQMRDVKWFVLPAKTCSNTTMTICVACPRRYASLFWPLVATTEGLSRLGLWYHRSLVLITIKSVN